MLWYEFWSLDREQILRYELHTLYGKGGGDEALFLLSLTGNRLSKTSEKRSYSESNSEHRSDLGVLNHSNQAQLCVQVAELYWVTVVSAAVQM